MTALTEGLADDSPRNAPADLKRFPAFILGPERVVTDSDCGFGTVDPTGLASLAARAHRAA